MEGNEHVLNNHEHNKNIIFIKLNKTNEFYWFLFITVKKNYRYTEVKKAWSLKLIQGRYLVASEHTSGAWLTQLYSFDLLSL